MLSFICVHKVCINSWVINRSLTFMPVLFKEKSMSKLLKKTLNILHI